MTDRELMQQALEALKLIDEAMPFPVAKLTIKNLRERLAQPETVMAEYKLQTYAAYKTDGEMKIGVVPVQEPVAWLHPANATCVTTDPNAYARGIPLYTTPQPRQWVGLTDADMAEPRTHIFDFIDGALWAEAKLREKNT